jgi:hypothetical protein
MSLYSNLKFSLGRFGSSSSGDSGRSEQILSRKFIGKVFCDNNLKILPRIPSESIDLVVTDPPYVVRYRSRDGRTLFGDA